MGIAVARAHRSYPDRSGYISKVENGYRIPVVVAVRAWDEALEAGGRLVALLKMVPPEGFEPGCGSWSRSEPSLMSLPSRRLFRRSSTVG